MDESGNELFLLRLSIIICSDECTAQVIDEIKHLSPGEQAEVVRFAFELAKTRQLTAEELGKLAERLETSTDPAEIARLRSLQ